MKMITHHCEECGEQVEEFCEAHPKATIQSIVSPARIEILKFSSIPELALEGWNPNACDAADYESARAARLYEALGVDPADEEYALAQHTDGRWALIGLSTSGHRFAAEVQS